MSGALDFGPGFRIVICDEKQYKVHVLTLEDHHEAMLIMDAERPSPMEAVAKLTPGLDMESKRVLLEEAYKDMRRGGLSELSEVVGWYRTPKGRVFYLQKLFGKYHPELEIKDHIYIMDNGHTPSSEEMSGVPEGNGQSRLETTEAI